MQNKNNKIDSKIDANNLDSNNINIENNEEKLYKKALDYHAADEVNPAGKITITPSKTLNTQEELALAYSPGVAAPCLKIKENIDDIYKYTAKGNLVAVVTNGTAVLGLGNIGAAAAKPVMEGKAVLFKKFANIDAINLEFDTENIEEFVNLVKHLDVSFGGINLEDIKAPECFIIEEKLQSMMNIPVFHDDQHGTAIITAAALINAALIQSKNLSDLNIVINGAGAAAIACINLFTHMGISQNQITLCDSRGVIYKGRKDGMNIYKEKYAIIDNGKRSLQDAMKDSDVLIGLSVKDAVTKEMVKSMANNPIIFVMANPDPEISPEKIKEVRSDAIIATGRSDYDNQVNNVMGFPYIFKGALDTRSRSINIEMKIAAAKAIADLARDNNIPDIVYKAYGDKVKSFGKDYIIPVPFDPRLMKHVSFAVAKAAIESGVARNADFDLNYYKD